MPKKTYVKIPIDGPDARELEFLRGISPPLRYRYRQTMHLRDNWGDLTEGLLMIVLDAMIAEDREGQRL